LIILTPILSSLLCHRYFLVAASTRVVQPLVEQNNNQGQSQSLVTSRKLLNRVST
jgi:hypothetical protein